MCLQFLTLYWKMMWMRSWHQVTRKWARLFAMKEFYLKGNCMEMHSQIYTIQTFMDSIILCFGVDSVDRYYHARHNRCVLAISTSGNLSTCYAGRNSLASSGSGIVGRIGRNFFDSTSSKLQAIWKHRYGNCSGLGKGSDFRCLRDVRIWSGLSDRQLTWKKTTRSDRYKWCVGESCRYVTFLDVIQSHIGGLQSQEFRILGSHKIPSGEDVFV